MKNSKARASSNENKTRRGFKGGAVPKTALPVSYHSDFMKTSLIIPAVFLIVFMAGVAGHEGAPFWAYFVVFIALVNTVVSLYYYLLIVKAMYIKPTDSPLPTFKSDVNTKVALALCTAGIILFGIVSCIYDWIYAATAM